MTKYQINKYVNQLQHQNEAMFAYAEFDGNTIDFPVNKKLRLLVATREK